MEPNNFEEDFRKKLNQRIIEPSDKAWDRLDAMLNIVEDKKPKKKYIWLYLAASIMGFLLVGTIFFTQKISKTDLPQNNVVVKENSKKDTIKELAKESATDYLNTSKEAEKEVLVSEKATIKKTEKVEKNQSQEPIQIINKEKNQIAESSIIIKNNQSNQVTTVDNSKNESVDQLFNAAEKNVLAENTAKPKAKVKVSASDLLDQVDGELELSFREKVIAKATKNYQTVKVAVANRNQKEQ